jgi:hypothetical protein
VNDVGIVLDRADVEQPELREDLARRLQHAQAVEHGVPLAGLIRSGRIGREEHRGGDLARPVQREGIHGLQHTAAHRVEQRVVVRGNRLGRERLELELAAGFLLEAVAPRFEQLVAGGA